jgi:hypothetical protein
MFRIPRLEVAETNWPHSYIYPEHSFVDFISAVFGRVAVALGCYSCTISTAIQLQQNAKDGLSRYILVPLQSSRNGPSPKVPLPSQGILVR